ncbi:MAG TPA: carboxymuconolactone decarboxylase family protein [Solirubrobacteraceae bacterium]|nr:carboxymuconolactone decarboxylase family protein [Solirubrobacteraceae bacterium]
MPRLPYYDPADGPDAIAKHLERTPLALFRIVAHAESAFEPWLRYSAALLTRLELDPLARELAILQVAHLVNSPYEWSQHVAIAKAVGASDAQILAIETQRDAEAASLSGEQKLLLRFSREVILDGAASERSLAELSELIGPRQVVELLLVLGNYMAIARLIASAGLEPEEPVVAGPSPNGLAE